MVSFGFAQQQRVQCTDLPKGGIFISTPPISAPQPIYTPQPEYRSSERRGKTGIQGTCLLGVKVSEQGRVIEVHVTRSLDHGLDQLAMDAVKRWRFKPAMREDKPVDVCISVEVDFQRD